MTKQALARIVDTVEATDAQIETALGLIRDNRDIGTTDALRQAGIAGTKGQLATYAKTELADRIREARYPIEPARLALYTVAVDTDHPAWQRANAFFLKAYGGPEFRDQHRVDVNHTGTVDIVKREVSLTGVLHILAAAGVTDDRPREELADTGDVLPALTD